MRHLALAVCLFAVGCVGTTDNTNPPTEDGGVDLAHPNGQGSTDMAQVIVDLAGVPQSTDLAGKAAFGGSCTTDTDCASNMCRGFVQQTIHRCTQACTAGTAATDCPSPPSAGTCTPNLYCKFTM